MDSQIKTRMNSQSKNKNFIHRVKNDNWIHRQKSNSQSKNKHWIYKVKTARPFVRCQAYPLTQITNHHLIQLGLRVAYTPHTQAFINPGTNRYNRRRTQKDKSINRSIKEKERQRKKRRESGPLKPHHMGTRPPPTKKYRPILPDSWQRPAVPPSPATPPPPPPP